MKLGVSVFLACLLACFSLSLAHASIAKNNGKYAALVMDADTGQVYFSRNADSQRYPASLTKMMTLYMMFEALRDGRMHLNTYMPVSERAASQPQTNISLKVGERIKVRDAINALVVRSANDVAVVVAEALGKTEDNFARNMTTKARSLGMRKTQFRNAHGLPDRNQRTSARDMAKLAIALRRDFPQYYHFFKTKKFTWKGKAYTSHNRVLDQFDGVDGLKTGYIRMSGFNLATSVKRDGYHIVSIVMGGKTGQQRNAHMVELLEDTFNTIAERGDQPRLFANAPKPKSRPNSKVLIGQTEEWKDAPWRVAARREAKKKEPKKNEIKVTEASFEPKKETKPKAKNTIRFFSDPKKASVEPNTLNFQLASLNSQPVFKEKWGIQVGAFSDERAALHAAAKAVRMAKTYLKDSKVRITDQNRKATSIHRARLANLSEYQAKKACETLLDNNSPCFVFKADKLKNL